MFLGTLGAVGAGAVAVGGATLEVSGKGTYVGKGVRVVKPTKPNHGTSIAPLLAPPPLDY